MDLQSLLQFSNDKESIFVKQRVSEETLRNNLSSLRNLISFFREYPDLFIDFCKGDKCKFKFYDYQRIYLRAVMRHRYIYATYPRSYSKSFLGMMSLLLKAVLFPGSHLFVTTGGKFIII